MDIEEVVQGRQMPVCLFQPNLVGRQIREGNRHQSGNGKDSRESGRAETLAQIVTFPLKVGHLTV
jgi:hypothetical protein